MHGTHLVDHIQHHELLNDNTLHVVAVCSNPVRYHSRYRTARDFIREMAATKHVTLHIVETAFGDRQHELADICKELNVSYLPLRTRSEIWIKENMINLGVKYLVPRTAKYIAWVDADVKFMDPNWAQETLHQLQHFAVVQPWSDCTDMGPMGGIMKHFKSFGAQHQRRKPKQMHPGQTYYEYAHSGFAWACRRDFWEAVGGLIDFAILGSADHHMAFAMIGKAKDTIHKDMSKGFFDGIYGWQTKARRITHDEVGFVVGMIMHNFHGPKNRRFYRERWQIPIIHEYDPAKDITYDSQGVIQLMGKSAFEQDIRLYNRSRHEDSIEEN